MTSCAEYHLTIILCHHHRTHQCSIHHIIHLQTSRHTQPYPPNQTTLHHGTDSVLCAMARGDWMCDCVSPDAVHPHDAVHRYQSLFAAAVMTNHRHHHHHNSSTKPPRSLTNPIPKHRHPHMQHHTHTMTKPTTDTHHARRHHATRYRHLPHHHAPSDTHRHHTHDLSNTREKTTQTSHPPHICHTKTHPI